MRVYAKHVLKGGSYSLLEVAEASRTPLAPELLQIITTFPLNVVLAVTAFLVIVTVFTLTRKPTRSKKADVDLEGQPMQKVDDGTPDFVQEADMVGRPAQEVEEEMPRRFEGNKEGVVKLYNWFYRFAQRRLNGVTGNMTPKEFESVVAGMIPPDGVSALEYLVTSFEIANYSNFKITKEMVDKSLRAIEVLKGLIENGGSSMHEHDPVNVESHPSVQP